MSDDTTNRPETTLDDVLRAVSALGVELRETETRLAAKLDAKADRADVQELVRDVAGQVLRMIGESEERVRNDVAGGLAGLRDDIANAREDARTQLGHEIALIRSRLAALERKVYGEGDDRSDERA